MVLELFYEFKSILHSMKSVHALEYWIKKASINSFGHINSFITGIKKDYNAVKIVFYIKKVMVLLKHQLINLNLLKE